MLEAENASIDNEEIEPLLSPVEEVDFEEKLDQMLASDEWPASLLAFVEKWMKPLGPDEEKLRKLRGKLDFLAKVIPAESFETAGYHWGSFLSKRTSFLKALYEELGPEQWEQLLQDDETCRQLKMASGMGPIHRLSKAIFAEFDQRDEVPLEVQAGMEGSQEEFEAVVKSSGIGAIAKHVANKLILGRPTRQDEIGGAYDNRTADITATVGPENRAMIVPVLLHELGHAVEKRLGWDEEARALFDRYIVLTQREETAHSPYADAIAISGKRSEIAFVYESFAEDFRLFWLKPEALSMKKRGILGRFVDQFLPDVNVDEVREKLRQTLGNFYGTNVDEVLKKIDCRDKDKIVKKLDEAKKVRREKWGF